MAKHFALAGAASLVLVDFALPSLDETVKICNAEGSQAIPFACDVSDEDQVNVMLDEVVTRVGHIDVLVNCAGVCTSKPIFLDTFSAIWREVRINLGGVNNPIFRFAISALSC